LLQSNCRVSIITPIQEAKGSNRLMQITLLKSKLHHANVTHAELEYEGSCAIDGTLLAAANIHEYEQIQIYNLNNGERFTTYAIRAEDHSGIISVNGAAAHKANPGDRIIICTYAVLSQQEASIFKPTLVYLDENNRIKASRNAIPVQVA
jgi:aspartate 1-decarboxylase